jgi:putative transposase
MLIRQAFVCKLKPDGAQARKLSRFAGCARWVYNQGLEWNKERRLADPNFHINLSKLCTELLVWKQQNPWLKETNAQVLQQSLIDLLASFQNFFKGLAAYPKKHRKFAATDSFRYPQHFKIDEGRRQVYLPSIGWVKYRRSRFIKGKAKNITVSRKADGWHMSIQTEYEAEPPRHAHAGSSVGIDMGCVRFCTLSDGTFFKPCAPLKKNLKKLAWMQRRLARMQKYGKNWRKQKASIARLHQHIANVRRDFIEKVSLEICKNHAEIFREDLKIQDMTASAKGTAEEPGHNVAQKSGLNRSILDQGWGIFFSKLDWKALRLGGHVYKVPPQDTSRTCPICGCVSKDNRRTQALFKCVSCGHHGNADAVAAVNIKERGRSSLACGEPEANARTRVNSGRFKKPAPNQQQESIEEISSASC